MDLSIVLPIYNVEKYLEACLYSIYSQNMNHLDFEVIAVDDCSPDHCFQILSSYKEKYSNFRIIKHGKNMGLGAARNTGLKNVKGQYVWFIDSDDCIPLDAFSHIEKYLFEDIDLFMFQIKTLETNGNVMDFYANYPKNTGVISGIDFLNSTLVPHWQKPVTAWSRIQKVKFLLDNNFKYPEGIFFEDEELNLKELFACKRMRYSTHCCYYYRVNDSSIMHTKFTPRKFVDKISVFLNCLKIIDGYKVLYPKLVQKISLTYLSVLRQMVDEYKKMNKGEQKQVKVLFQKLDFSILCKYKTYNIKYLLYFQPKLFDKLIWIIR